MIRRADIRTEMYLTPLHILLTFEPSSKIRWIKLSVFKYDQSRSTTFFCQVTLMDTCVCPSTERSRVVRGHDDLDAFRFICFKTRVYYMHCHDVVICNYVLLCVVVLTIIYWQPGQRWWLHKPFTQLSQLSGHCSLDIVCSFAPLLLIGYTTQGHLK